MPFQSYQGDGFRYLMNNQVNQTISKILSDTPSFRTPNNFTILNQMLSTSKVALERDSKTALLDDKERKHEPYAHPVSKPITGFQHLPK